MTMFARPTQPVAAAPPVSPAEPAPGKRPPAWSLRNWPVRWKVFAIALIPLILATTFGVLRVRAEWDSSDELRLAAARANMIPAITNYMSALDVALLAGSTGRDVEGAKKNFAARKTELQLRLADTNVIADVRSGVNTLLNDGQSLVDKVLSDSIPVRERITSYAPLLLTAEDAINASVRADTEQIRAQVQGLSRALGARGQMTMQEILVTRGAELPEPQLRSSMITLAGTEPSTLFGLNQLLGIGSPETKTLQQQMVSRLAILSDPANELVDNPDLLRSIETTKRIAEQVISDNATPVTKSVQSQAIARRDAATRDAVLVLGAIVIALAAVLLVARTLVRPLRVLRDGALKVAHTDLAGEIEAVRGGADPVPVPLAVYTTEEIGQVAHAVDELHTQALQLAGDEARLRLLVNDMFETMSRRSRSLVDQQLKLIDGLERKEEDPERLETLFRLDHLAARLRRNSANLLVLAGAQITRDNREPVPLSTVLNAAVSEVEDYRRVEIADLPDCTVVGSAAGGVIHMLAELIDNALRYSPPTTQVKVSAVRGKDGGALLRVADSGLGMTESDRRMANMRLQAGGEVTPDNARHMGLFVVGRLASRHGIRVGLRGPAAGESGSGTTAEVYLPAAVLVGTAAPESAAPKRAAGAFIVSPPRPSADERGDQQAVAEPAANGAGATVPPVSLLPRRTPGTSGITDVPAQPSKRPRRELPTPWWEKGIQKESTPAAGRPQQSAATQPAPTPTAQPARASDTSAFFARRPPAPADSPDPPVKPAPKPADPAGPADDDVIYQRMLAEMMGDPHDLVESPDLDWKTVWDHGWSAAAAAEEQPVEAHTEHGLPVRNPGARLVPGSAESDADESVVRDPEAVRASIGSHFGGVHTGRSQAGDIANGSDRP
ncbi:ATP-binding protein [Mycobacterium intermedium]|uniref:histidine kinase n=1 Tax=Mycobacterium intermedium TaxID=28445 RepID=A0A1E3S5Q0_MYCIE|nr:ATP-binding protein [Mycobacterium intermedium]MCV6963367.1 HAMP domain-containing protein [Mycobacterium intermedium]ODQ97469.1 histidine kinase [Mycobacterium intermedium]OPE46670.1 ATP-binding protein [Mycobacterium intermedium]ORB02899.1 ATP-binding protein [Mycobacterium intermedium]